MDEQLILRMAQMQTLLDTIKLLEYLHNESSSTHHDAIDEMILRLTTMGTSL